MAHKTEFVAILSAGAGFNRILKPYLIGAFIIGFSSLLLSHFVIPKAQKIKIGFDRHFSGGIDPVIITFHIQNSIRSNYFMNVLIVGTISFIDPSIFDISEMAVTYSGYPKPAPPYS